MNQNFLHLIDFYKADHRRQYPSGTSLVFSNFTPRKSRILDINNIIFFGLQYFIKEYLVDRWNNTQANPKTSLHNYIRRISNSLGKDAITFEHIEALLEERNLPIEIWALPEGSRVPIGVPAMVMWNTKPEFFWLVNYLETILSCSLWQTCTSATIADHYYSIFSKYAKMTGASEDGIIFQGHDFSFRGMSSLESACLSGAGHLTSFCGTDTVPAIDFLEKYYEADSDTELIGASVPATEHSVMSMGGKDNEIETFRRILKLYPKGIVSIVSDTWNYWDVLTKILPQLKSEIMNRDGKVVIRPDSSPLTPFEIICGNRPYGDTLLGSPEYKGSIQVLWEIFGGKVNDAGFKELDPHIGLIYGDSITPEIAVKICSALAIDKFASTNWVAGIGSYTYQYNTRDTFGWAMKATYGEINGVGHEIFKDPITDSGFKKSAKGLLATFSNNNKLFLKQQATWEDVKNCQFEKVYPPNKYQSLKDIRTRIKESRSK